MHVTSWFAVKPPPRLLLLAAAVLTLLMADSDCRQHDSQNKAAVKPLWAVEGEDIELPCNLKPNGSIDDEVTMVLWFKDEASIPLYSLDARAGDIYKAVHWAMSSSLGNRTYFQVDKTGHARLKVKAVAPHDQGVFRCRVDFANSPTHNYRINLTLIEPPSKPVIYDAQGREVTGVGGPFLEGYDLILTCQVSGGKPRPTVTWWQGDEMLDGIMEEPVAFGINPNSKFTINRLFIERVTRDLGGAKLECRAESGTRELVRRVVKKVPLEIYLKPAMVSVTLMEEEIFAGRPMTARCETWGSSPAARIVWRLGGLVIRESSLTTAQRSNSTASKMALVLDKSDDGKELTCRAENPRFPGGVLEMTKVLRVLYAPSASAELATGFNMEVLREGDDIKFACNYHSNPEPTSIEWLHNDKLLQHNVEAGILLASSTLTLRELKLENSGSYACLVRNIVGEARSQPINVYMKYTPRCKESHESQNLIASRGETLRLRCEIEADPRDGVRFSWTRNSSVGDVYAVSNPRAHSSSLEYTPRSDEDFGTLACWASNSVGRQKRPCVFNILPAKPPQSPSDCSIRNESSAMEVNCIPGSSGGLAQHFLLEVRGILDNATSLQLQQMMPQSDQGTAASSAAAGAATSSLEITAAPLYLERADEPSFQLYGLLPGYNYTVAVYAENSQGRSEPHLIENVRVAESSLRRTPMSAESRFLGEIGSVIPDTRSIEGIAIIVGIILVTSAVFIGTGVLIGIVICRRRSRNDPTARQCVDSGPDDFTTPTYIAAQRIEPKIRYGHDKSRSQPHRASLYEAESRIEPDLLQQVDIDLQSS
ncbi:neural cell adhesion molecule 2 [Trichogramma pretiosum]|uniref:neural cell adhesion molecule 2 n=1 Tax=Trichogramma pretiosum TaxID=7493 RepID=UPI0006C9B4FA|nr:neural cell adhesion molecule 2 [Trichogramma pretiosum]